MDHPILMENQKNRLGLPMWRLVCLAMFVFWQMGFIYYFLEPSSALDGKIPISVDMNYTTALTAICYLISILVMIFIPMIIVWLQRIATGVALLTSVFFFLPLPDDALRLIIYLQIFCCCLMIGFETFLVVNIFSESSGIKYLTFAYSVGIFLIAIVQNEFLSIPFSTFRFGMTAALILLLIFFIYMPSGKEHQPRFVKKSDGLTAPKKLIRGVCLLAFIIALMGVSCPAIAGKVKHGVSIMYLVVALTGFVLDILYTKANVHPFRLMPLIVGLGGLGFLFMLASDYVPALSYVACGFIGFGMAACMLGPLYGVPIVKSYPTRYTAPCIIGFALVAVLIHSVIAEIFLGAPILLYLVYAVIMAVLVFVFTQVEPFLLFTLRHRITDEETVTATEDNPIVISPEAQTKDESEVTADADASDYPLLKLSPKKREVAELICLGYTNRDIAKTLFLSEHTVKDYTKDIYLTLDVHSRIELAALVNKYQLIQKK